jgi:hypothetical protein
MVRLTVVDREKRPVDDAVAELIDARARVISSAAITRGRGEICDIPFGSYSIKIDTNAGAPHPVIIVGVIGDPFRVQSIEVILDTGPSGDVGPEMGTGCLAYLRVVQSDGAGVQGVEVEGVRGVTTDRYGRARFVVPLGKLGEYVVVKSGFLPRRLSLACAETTERLERMVVLRPR